MNPEVSNFVHGVDTDFKIIFGISIFFLVGITAFMIWIVIRYNKKRHPKPVQIKDNMVLELTWTIIPFIIVMLLFYYGYVAYKPMRDVPKDAMVVKAIGRMWDWTFVYSNGKENHELVVPLNKPIKLDLVSIDVIHSLYIPAYRIKEDMVPGKENYMWFIPQQLGEYEILCAEYCGLRHSFMESRVRVLTEADFTKWLASLPEKKSEDDGLTVMKTNGCTGCHSLDGHTTVSTSFKGLFGSKRTVESDGNEIQVVADSIYIKNSILDPNMEVVKGFSKGIMKSYKGIIKEEDISKIIKYLETIK
jgi:cytochrome c oxidase subunit II